MIKFSATSPPPPPNAAGNDLQEMITEARINGNAYINCQESLTLENDSARPAFQHRAFEGLIQHPLPLGQDALVSRVRALQVILCGRADPRYDAPFNGSPILLRQYAEDMIQYGHALKAEECLMVQLEENEPNKVMRKQRYGADTVTLPTFDLWCIPEVRQSLYVLFQPHPFGDESTRCLDRFGNTNRYWFTLPISGEYTLLEQLQEDEERR